MLPVKATHPVLRVLSALVLVSTLLVGQGGVASAERSRTAEEARVENLIAQMHNAARQDPAAWGIDDYPAAPPMTGWTDIRSVAQRWSDEMATTDDFRHNPDFSTQYCCWNTASENIGWAWLDPQSDNAAEEAALTIMEAWIGSAPHLETLMDPRLDEFAVGISIDEHGYAWITVNFRARDRSETPSGKPFSFGTYSGQGLGGEKFEERPAPVARDNRETCDAHQDRGFRDTEGTTHDYSIRCIVGMGITSGKTSDTYGGQDLLTRGQSATFLRKALAAAGHPVPDAEEDHFDDDDGNLHEDSINALAEAGVIGPTRDRRIEPGRPQTRAEMARWVFHALREPADTSVDYYHDDEGHLHEDAINGVSDAGIVTGRGKGVFGPEETLRRDQMATFLSRFVDVLARGMDV